MTDEDERLPEELINDLARLRTRPLPPDALQSRVLEAARTAGLIRRSACRTRLAQLAASVLLLLAGAATGRMLPPRDAPSASTQVPARYLLLLADDVEPAPDGGTRGGEYAEWARDLSARGIAVDGEELGEQSALVGSKGARFAELASVGGYFLIEADSDAAAAALARTCPHVKYGGSVIIRKVVQSREP